MISPNYEGIVTRKENEVNEMPKDSCGTVLTDYSSTGRERPWQKHKANSKRLAWLYRKANESLDKPLMTSKQIESIEHCGDYLEFAVYEGGAKKLKNAHFCRGRLCPMCQWRRALKLSFRLRGALEKLAAADDSVSFVFATFTVKNCVAEKLSDTLNEMTTAFSAMVRTPSLKSRIRGYCRTIEVSFNERRKDYHPHIHALFVVDKRYFSGMGYIRHSEWRLAWASAMHLDYLPMVNVKKADIGVAVEVAKYSVKGLDALTKIKNVATSVEILKVLHTALKGRRLVSAGGVLKDSLQDFDRDLIRDEENEDLNTAAEIGRVIYKWIPSLKLYIDCGIDDSILNRASPAELPKTLTGESPFERRR